MTNIELYINKQLCNIQSPEKLGVRLNRVLITPSELSTKDAQYSYSITIPSSPINDAIFGYANVEEVKNKFNHTYTAQLYVDSVRIFDGQFKISQIDSDGSYKGNLVIPAKRTIKDIFGDKKMTEIEGEWKLDLSDLQNQGQPLTMVDMLNKYNSDKGCPACIFPLTLYGLLPKVPQDKEGKYSGKTSWDKYVRLGIHDFPPSINCLQAIKQIFNSHKDSRDNEYFIGGTAFDDARLVNLYMSYKNPTNYQQEWNWGHLGKFKIKGSWTNYKIGENNTKLFEQFFYRNDDGGRWNHFYTANLLSSSMVNIEYIKDEGTNVFESSTKVPEFTEERKNIHITIPHSGLYKIQLEVDLKVKDNLFTESCNGYKYIGGQNPFNTPYEKVKRNDFTNSRYEVKLLRDFGEGSFHIDEMKFDATLYRDNLAQSNDSKITRYFPLPGGYGEEGVFDGNCIQMIDPLQNINLISGFRWGEYGKSMIDSGKIEAFYPDRELAPNPLEEELSTPFKYRYNRIMAIKHGWSWDTKFSQKNKIYSAIHSPGYKKIQGTDPDNESEEVEADNMTNLFKVILNDAPNHIENIDNITGKGKLNQIVWLEKGEHLTLVSVTSSGHNKGNEGWMVHDINFSLEVEPFRTNPEWISVNNKGTGTAPMDWNDSSDFKKDYINLFKFLPSEEKIDEWLNNFCKAFNLQLTQSENNKFELNVKQLRNTVSIPSIIDLDDKTSITQRTNEPLGLPSEFKLGFKINEEEEGYIKAGDDNKDGGGSYFTGNIDGQVVVQTSNFSYNWFKQITKDIVIGKDGEGEDIIGTMELELPVIANKEIWGEDPSDYAQMLKKLYTNYSQRFWYKNNKTYNVGVVWKHNEKQVDLLLPRLQSNMDNNSLVLNYYNNPRSILTSYFSIIATDDSNYTYVECYLSPYEYEQLDGSKLVKLNGDLYYIAAVEGYDPMGRNKTKLKLIRKV